MLASSNMKCISNSNDNNHDNDNNHQLNNTLILKSISVLAQHFYIKLKVIQLWQKYVYVKYCYMFHLTWNGFLTAMIIIIIMIIIINKIII